MVWSRCRVSVGRGRGGVVGGVEVWGDRGVGGVVEVVEVLDGVGWV